MRLTALAALMACPFVACYCTLSVAEGAEAEKIAATCAKSRVSMCIDYLAPMSAKSEKICKDTHGVVAKDGKACPTDKRVGSCLATNFEGVQIRSHFYEGAKDPKGTCESIKGTWEPVAK